MLSSGQSRCWPRSAAVAAHFRRLVLTRRMSSAAQNEDASQLRPEAEDQKEEQQRVRTDVSRLRRWHHRKYHNRLPEIDEDTQHLTGLTMQRKLWALHGRQSGINPAIAWPVQQEWADKMEYESLAYPDTLQQMVEKFRAEELAKQTAIEERMRSIDEKLVNLEKWKKEIINKRKKKEEELRTAQEKRDKMIAEVKEIVGFRVDPKDARFKEVLEQKELEEKKVQKEAKKREKQRKQLEKLRKMAEIAAQPTGASSEIKGTADVDAAKSIAAETSPNVKGATEPEHPSAK